MEINLGILVLVAFLGLVVLRVPVFVALLAPSLLYVVTQDFPLSFPAQHIVQSINTFTLLAIPLFILVGNTMNESGVTDRIFEFTTNLIGHIDGGLAHVNITASLIFSGMSGSALADIGGIGQVLINSMVDDGYDRGFAAGVTSASATVGPIFPPSIPLIVYGLVAEVSVLNLLLAGVGPALLVVGMLMLGTHITVHRNDELIRTRDRERVPTRDLVVSTVKAAPALVTPVLLIVGMLAGFFGPTEIAVVTAVYVAAIGAVFYRGVSMSSLWTAGKKTVYSSGSVMIIVASAALFSFVMSIEGIDQVFASLIFGISTNPLVALLLVNVFLLVIGLFIEPIAAIVMSVPIVVPPLVELGVDPVHLGVVMVFNLMLGLLTPPLGLSLFICEDIAGVPVPTIIGSLKPYYVILLVSLLLITFLPSISLFLI